MQYGLAAAPLVRWLISSERDVFEAVQAFIGEQTDRDYVDVAGPPTEADRVHYQGRSQVCPLPVVRLNFKMARSLATGEPGVEVRCDDKDLTEIERWWREARARRRAAS